MLRQLVFGLVPFLPCTIFVHWVHVVAVGRVFLPFFLSTSHSIAADCVFLHFGLAMVRVHECRYSLECLDRANCFHVKGCGRPPNENDAGRPPRVA